MCTFQQIEVRVVLILPITARTTQSSMDKEKMLEEELINQEITSGIVMKSQKLRDGTMRFTFSFFLTKYPFLVSFIV